ncbi:MAG TPA: NAD(P)H-hydrate dehydratase [Longimicrobium sp.]|nr:NAD(P)H-hydrate dehydratase [Longimicrobium sp.]
MGREMEDGEGKKGGAIVLTPARMRRMPLPDLDPSGDKDSRGRVLVAGGSAENPGGILLAAEAALRAGAGKLQVATVESVAAALGAAIPEARVFGLAASGGDGVSPKAAARIAECAERVDALLLGPGLIDEEAAGRLAASVLKRVRDIAVVLDAGALAALREDRGALAHLGGRAVLTPHGGEMAQLLEMEREEVEADPEAAARRAAEAFGAVVALKGADTVIVAPDGAVYRYERGGPGLGTSGSGDVLAGIATGLLARGADPATAAAWAVHLHGEAGNALAKRHGPVGFLARELPGEIPAIMRRLSPAPPRSTS